MYHHEPTESPTGCLFQVSSPIYSSLYLTPAPSHPSPFFQMQFLGICTGRKCALNHVFSTQIDFSFLWPECCCAKSEMSRQKGDFAFQTCHVIEIVTKLFLVIQNATAKPPEVHISTEWVGNWIFLFFFVFVIFIWFHYFPQNAASFGGMAPGEQIWSQFQSTNSHFYL